MSIQEWRRIMDENKSAEAANEREVSFNNVSEASNVTNEVPSKQQ